MILSRLKFIRSAGRFMPPIDSFDQMSRLAALATKRGKSVRLYRLLAATHCRLRPRPKRLHEKRGYLPQSKLPLHASVFCQFQVAYTACAPGSARARIREKPRRGLPPRRGFSLVARQSPLGRTALIGPLHALASVISQGRKNCPR
jgi:hypothetical protein